MVLVFTPVIFRPAPSGARLPLRIARCPCGTGERAHGPDHLLFCGARQDVPEHFLTRSRRDRDASP